MAFFMYRAKFCRTLGDVSCRQWVRSAWKTVQWTVFSGERAAAPVLFVKQESPHIIYKCYKKEQNQPFFSFSFLKKESILLLYVLMPTLEGGTYD